MNPLNMCITSRWRCALLTSILVSLTACGATEPPSTALQAPQYEAHVVRTAYGIPHITADSWGSLGFGEAYSAAEDHVCNMAVALLQARGESAKVFGVGSEQRNLGRDVLVKALDIPSAAAKALAEQPTDIREWIEGYAAGYNQYLKDHADGVGSWCNEADWVQPVQAADFMAQYLTLAQTLPRIGNAIIAATLPLVEKDAAPTLATTLDDLRLDGMGSNAWALAKSRTEGANSLLLANPHYPWYGIARFWEKHLTIPGVYNAYGASLIGTPGVAIGFNNHVGWSHTVSDSKRTVIYQLTLNPENSEQYRWENGWRNLTPIDVSVEVLASGETTSIPQHQDQDQSQTQTQTHTVWFSHHGPLLALPGLTKDPYTVFAVRDANANNTSVLGQWQAMGQATGMDDFIDAHRRFNAMPWVNTIAVSKEGRAVYIDNSTVGALSEQAIDTWKKSVEHNPTLKQLYLAKGLVILDGSKAVNDWINTSAPIANTEPFEHRPLIESDSYVFNANDSYWLSDPDKPAASLSPLYGATHSPRSVRTRANVALLKPDSPWGYAGSDGRFSMQEVQAALFGNDSLSAELLLPDLLAACADAPERTLSEHTVDLSNACAVLTNWDRKFNLDSRGAVLFREWLTRYPYTETFLGPSLFSEPFNATRPLATPARLNNSNDALDKLAKAVLLLEQAGIPLDTPLGDRQIAHRMNEHFAIHGGDRWEGIANLQIPSKRTESVHGTRGQYSTAIATGSDDYLGDSATLSSTGYNVIHGSSFIMTLAFTDEGPRAQALLSYSQSGNPDSRHFSDQTALYRDKQWRDILFWPDSIAQESVSQRKITSGFDNN